ncbi:hypothetical protein [Spirosoma utsteinense]|uniref:DUF4352 domain-containing protein n=1 Tax=Spirosoma utsteinense TaxID=2585773 RepID=A0ABR6W9K5_9BACT|nr:hypothetical protein [Spirosoma utsteinense]MBC3783963.1 hypothetical protein [Spirosoma utsteinense]MBC3792597.1 hypothetical protein [Spirosoma utsteinense]
MKTSSLPLFLLLIGLPASLLTGCVPTVMTHRLEPISGDLATIDGRVVTKAERDGVGVVASFEREDMDFVVLDVEVKNHTSHSIDVNPADFHFTALDAMQDTLKNSNSTGLLIARTAANPTYEMGRMGMKRKLEEKRLKRAKVINTILLVAAVASDVSATSSSRSYREWAAKRVSHDVAYQAIAAKRVIDHSTFSNRMQRYDYEEYRWRELALRENALASGESVRGFVYLPKVLGARYLAIRYTVPEQASVPLLFKQELVKNKKKRR